MTLEYILVKRYCCEWFKETFLCYRLLDPTLKKPAPGSKMCLHGRSGGSAIAFRASIDKKVLLGIVKGDTFMF